MIFLTLFASRAFVYFCYIVYYIFVIIIILHDIYIFLDLSAGINKSLLSFNFYTPYINFVWKVHFAFLNSMFYITFIIVFLKSTNSLTLFSCHDTNAFHSESTLYSCLNVKKLLPQSRRDIWIKWNVMSIVHGTPKGGVCKFCLTEKWWILVSAGTKKTGNQQKRGSFICTYIVVSYLVFVTKYFVFRFLEN